MPVGLVGSVHGLTFVCPLGAGGFSVEDHRRIPDGRVELLDGVAVVRPDPTAAQRRVVGELYQRLRETCPDGFVPLAGPVDVRAGPATVFRPDVVVVPRGEAGAVPVLVVEARPDRGAYYGWHERQAKLRAYRDAGVTSFWAVDPDTSAVVVYEMGFHRKGVFQYGEVCAQGRRRGWRPWSKPAGLPSVAHPRTARG